MLELADYLAEELPDGFGVLELAQRGLDQRRFALAENPVELLLVLGLQSLAQHCSQ